MKSLAHQDGLNRNRFSLDETITLLWRKILFQEFFQQSSLKSFCPWIEHQKKLKNSKSI